MKRSVMILLLVTIIFSSFVSAASYDLADFSKEPTQAIVVGQNDEVRFNLFNATHTVIFTKVVQDVGFRITGYAYMNDEYQLSGFATKKWSSHLDINRDNKSDLVVAYYDSTKDEKTGETYVTAIFKLEDNNANPMTGNAVGEPQGDVGVVKTDNYSKYLGPVGALVFILALMLMARKVDKKKSKEQPLNMEPKEEQ